MQPDILSLSMLFMLTGTIVISCDVIQRIKMELEQRQENAVSSPRLRDFPTVPPILCWLAKLVLNKNPVSRQPSGVKWGASVCFNVWATCVCAWQICLTCNSPPCWDNVCLDLMFAVRCQENSELLMIVTLLLSIKQYLIVLLKANIVFVSTAC